MDDFSKGLDIFCKPKFYLYQKNWIGCSNYWESWWTVFTLMENYSRYDVIRFVYNLDRKTQNTFVNECRPFSTHNFFRYSIMVGDLAPINTGHIVQIKLWIHVYLYWWLWDGKILNFGSWVDLPYIAMNTCHPCHQNVWDDIISR